VTFCWNDASTPDLLTDGTNTYLYGPDGLPIEQTSAAGTFWFVHDQEGSTLLLLASNGTISGAYSYTPYGLATHTGTATTPLQYTGQYTNANTGLVYLRARYYDPATALFLTVDPMVNSTHAAYIYVLDDPLNGVDLTGLCLSGFGWFCNNAGAIATGLTVAALVVGAVACTICDVAALGIGALSLATNGIATYQDCDNGRELTVNYGVDATRDALSVADFGFNGWSLIKDAGAGVHLADAAAEVAENAAYRAFVGDLTSLAGTVTGNVWTLWSNFWSSPDAVSGTPVLGGCA
jgi:RHS repeat-associated protein